MGEPICKKLMTFKRYPNSALHHSGSQGLDCYGLTEECFLSLFQEITAVSVKMITCITQKCTRVFESTSASLAEGVGAGV